MIWIIMSYKFWRKNKYHIFTRYFEVISIYNNITGASKAQIFVSITAERYKAKKFRKSLCPIVERLYGFMWFYGRNTGKKVLDIKKITACSESIYFMTRYNLSKYSLKQFKTVVQENVLQ